MGGSSYSRKKKKVEPSGHDKYVVLSSKFFRGVVPENSSWDSEKLKHPFDIKYIPLDKLYTTQNKMPIKKHYV